MTIPAPQQQYGDFTIAASFYRNRPGFGPPVVDCLAAYVGAGRDGFLVADIGAGTGKLTEMLRARGMRGYALEPNAAMLAEGQRLQGDSSDFTWMQATGEQTGLAASSLDWICASTAFHWMQPDDALQEWWRVIRPAGHLTVLWCLPDYDHCEIRKEIEAYIAQRFPGLKRAAEAVYRCMDGIERTLLTHGRFDDCLHVEARQTVRKTTDQFIASWRGVHDIPSQIGRERWEELLAHIRTMVGESDNLILRHRTWSWTVTRSSGEMRRV